MGDGMRAEYTVEIAAPIEHVFRWIDEPECVMQWLPHLAAYECLDETDDKAGTRVRQVWDDKGHQTELRGRITTYSSHSQLGIRLGGDRFKVEVDYILRDLDGRTELTQVTRFQYMGLLRWIDLVAGRSLRKSYVEELKRNLAKLAKLCESQS